MSLIRYLGYLAAQLVGYTVGTRRPGLLVVVVVGGAVVVLGLFIQSAAPVAIYPFL